MFISKNELWSLKRSIIDLKAEIFTIKSELEKLNEFQKKRYVSDVDEKGDSQLTTSAIIDEWLNGKPEVSHDKK